MKERKPSLIVRLITATAYIMMIAVNVLANTLPLNGLTTGKVSEMYPNLFAPAPVTFLIWGVIYLLLLGFSLYQLGCFGEKSSLYSAEQWNNTGLLFSVSSIANAAWIFAWHYGALTLSAVLIVLMLVCLCCINLMISGAGLNMRDKLFIRLPFAVYFGWITVAVIANITALLVDMGWDGFGMSESFWTVIVLCVGFFISALSALRIHSAVYGLTVLWAYAGILFKHLSPDGFGGAYPAIIVTVSICMVLLAALSIVLAASKPGRRRGLK